MASKARLKSGNFRVQIREKDFDLISKSFKTEQEADSYAERMDSGIAMLREIGKSKLPVDTAVLYRNLHPDLQKAVQLHPAFAKVLGRISGSELTLGRLIDEYMAQYTKKDRNIHYRLLWWLTHYGHLLISDFSEDHVRHGINVLLTVGATDSTPILPQTTNRFKANLSSVFTFGQGRYNLKDNPCQQIRCKPEGKGRKRYLSDEEQQRFVQAARKSRWDRFYLLVLMAITSGARRSELLKLRWNSIDWIKSEAFCGDTKNGSDKILSLTDAVRLELKRFRGVGSALIFGGPKKPTAAYDFRREWDIALQEAGIPVIDDKGEKIVFHSLRHTFCSTLANAGSELLEISILAGHRSLQTTMRYTHPSSRRLAGVVSKTFSNLGC